VEYLERLLELTPATDPARSALAIQLAKAHLSLSNYPAAHIAIAQAQAAATTDSDRAAALAVLGEMTTELADYTAAQTILAQAVGLARASDDKLFLCYSLSSLGNNYRHLGKLDEAQVTLNESLALAQVLLIFEKGKSINRTTLRSSFASKRTSVFEKYAFARCLQKHLFAIRLCHAAQFQQYIPLFASRYILLD
jgi:tetratricopeptide (TPR) repeat protein